MISIQVSVQQRRPTETPSSLISAYIQLAGRGATVPCGTLSSSPASPHHANILLEQASDSLLMGKLPLPMDNRPFLASSVHTTEDLYAALTGRLFPERSLKRSLPSTKTYDDDCCGSAPSFKRLRRELPRKKTVSFATDNDRELFQVIPVPEGEEYDCEARWYSRSDYNDFRQDMKTNFFLHSMWMRRKAQEKQARPPKEICIRGLEKFCFYSNQAANKDIRETRLNAVLDQQRIQKAVGIDDPMTIRMVAECLSRKVSEQAQERGTNDYRAALLLA